MSNQTEHSEVLNEKAGITGPSTFVEDNVKQDPTVVDAEEEKRLLRKIDLQSV
jgi:hypothetical protein